jgi:hypothetical protein
MAKPSHSDYEAISWRDRPITDLDKEGLLEALYYARKRITMLQEERDYLQGQLNRAKSAKSRKGV